MGGAVTAGTSSEQPTVFLSYARADQVQAAKLAAALEAAGLDVWWDTHIEGGAAFAKSIEAALERSAAVLVLWSKASIASDWVLDEAARGRDLHKLVPVSLDGTEPPLGFRQYQAVDLSSWRGQADTAAIDAIRRGIAAACGQPAPPLRSRPSPPMAAVQGSRRAVILAGLGLAAAGGGAALLWRHFGRTGSAEASGNSVAVLPFDNLSGDPEQAYFSDGLAEEVRATLARNLRLQVMAQASAGRFRDSTEDAQGIAEELGVAFLLDGSVRRAGDMVRVTADLIDGATGFSRWSEQFERRIDDVFAVQTEIATAVATALVAEVTEEPQAAPAPLGATRSIAAYDAYLRGRALYDLSADETSERAALAQFDAALAADPDFAAAHAARARSLTAIANQYGTVDELASLYDQAIVAAERAIALAPELAEAHSTLGFTLFQGRLDARAALAPFQRSRELGAGESTVLARYAQFSARVGRHEEAALAMQRAVQLDRLNPLIHRAAGSIAYAAREYESSLAPLREALRINPRLSRAHAQIGDALLMLGRLEAARAEYQAEPVPDFRLTGLALVERRLGASAAADGAETQLIDELGDRVLYQQAQIAAQRGDLERAIGLLARAHAIGDSGLVYLRNDPLLDPLRAEPRFRALLAGIGFE
jgi:TolB-like protein